ncbi:MAG: CehA/McbA family metallohydrolase [Acidobacteria bacterium]|nr:CehA/McbA family metallohydrolase [Acidobacteriota bacterium]
MRRALVGGALAALAVTWYQALPPRTPALPDAPDGVTPSVRGAFHVHTDRSDGTGTVDDVAAAAARAGLQFVVLTDHGDGTRAPSAPEYRQGVLSIDAVEISTAGGHVIALGMPAAPYPLAGEPRDVVEDIARLGGFSVAAHPGSVKPDLRWIEWTAPVNGLEWLNGDSEWRDESAWSLARALFTYPARRAETLATILDRPDTVLARWDVLTGRRRVVALAGADAHARLGLRSLGEPYENAAYLPVPSYEQVFRTFSIALPGITLTGRADADAQAIVDAIRRGRVYSAVDALGEAPDLLFRGTSGSVEAVGGDVLPVAGPVTLRVEVQATPDTQIDLLKDGIRVASSRGAVLQHITRDAGVYRVEVSLPGAPGQPPVPWILTNPIYVGQAGRPAPPPDPRPRASEFAVQYSNGPAPEWRIESSPESKGARDVVPASGGTQLSMRYGLGGTASSDPFAALVMPAGSALSGYDRLMFVASADRPTRLSVQLRTPAGEAGERWHRSVFVDSMPRQITVHFDDLTPRGVTVRRRPALSEVDSVLFVVDTVNTKLGGSGQIWIDDVKYAR